MKLDSEEQRTQLLELLAQVPIQATIGNIEGQAQAVTDILRPIRTAEIETEVEGEAEPSVGSE